VVKATALNRGRLRPITRDVTLDATLSRIAALETAFQPPVATPATASAGSATAVGSATMPGSAITPGSGMATNNFASALQGAMAPSGASAVAGASALGGAAMPGALTPATGAGASAIVQLAQSQVGQSEQPPGSNDSASIAMYRTATAGAAAGQPWCAYFVSWAARQAGEPIGAQGQGLGYVGDIWNWAQQTGRAVPNGPGVVPTPGELIVFGDHHVGIVDQVLPDGSIQTIEGNYNNQVSQVTRGAGEATGYVRM
jgi:hypothetical protein